MQTCNLRIQWQQQINSHWFFAFVLFCFDVMDYISMWLSNTCDQKWEVMKYKYCVTVLK